ncbi:MAG: hypothetical protein Q4G69_14735 [Planctomycetia bacterium]|nr:hypothetical protein [Planctomycetia bacterium]
MNKSTTNEIADTGKKKERKETGSKICRDTHKVTHTNNIDKLITWVPFSLTSGEAAYGGRSSWPPRAM